MLQERRSSSEPDMAHITEQDTTFTEVGPKHSARSGKLTQTNPDMEVSNPYAALSDLEEEAEPLPPPRTYTIKANVQKVNGNLLKALTGPHKEHISIRYGNNYLIVKTKGEEAKNHVAKQLNKSQITIEPIETDKDNHEKLTIKGLPPSITEDEIKAELASREFPITHVRQIVKHSIIQGKKTSEPLPVWVLTFTKTDTLQDKLKTLNALFHIRIRLEKYRGIQGVRQCFNCQGFGHVANLCNKRAKCVRCGENHKLSDCPNTNTLKCANCQDTHTASYRQCNIYRQAVTAHESRVQAKTKKHNSTHTANSTTSPTPRTTTRPNMTYSHIVQNNQRRDKFPLLPTENAQAQDPLAQLSLTNMDLSPILNLLTMISKQPHLLDVIITLATALKNNGP